MVSPSTRRWHAWNERRKRGVYLVPIELNDAYIARMLDLGLISERDSTNSKKIGKAIKLALANAFGDMSDHPADT